MQNNEPESIEKFFNDDLTCKILEYCCAEKMTILQQLEHIKNGKNILL